MFKIFGQTGKKFDKFETLFIGPTPTELEYLNPASSLKAGSK